MVIKMDSFIDNNGIMNENFIGKLVLCSSRCSIIKMKLLAYIVFALQYPMQSISLKTNIPFVKDYLMFNNIRICSFLSCDITANRMKNQFDFRHDNVWINWWSITNESQLSHLNYTNTLGRFSSPISVVIDLECNESVEVLKEISSRKMFHHERSWVVFGKNLEQSYDILKTQFINMDAEIYLLLRDNAT